MNARVAGLLAAISVVALAGIPMTADVAQSAIDSTWLNTHCVTGDSASTDKPAFQAVHLYREGQGVHGAYRVDIEEKIEEADRALAESSQAGEQKQHFRFQCIGSPGAWTGLFIRVKAVPVGESVSNCDQIESWARNGEFNNPSRKYLIFLAGNLNTSCGPGITYYSGDGEPGADNVNNSTSAHVFSQAGADGSWVNSYGEASRTVLHEMLHALGAVVPGAPGYYSAGGDHTKDWPDALSKASGGRHCEAKDANMTIAGSLVDCGQDTYWDPRPNWAATDADGGWLCRHWNIATDSLYVKPLIPRPAACPG